MQLKQENGKSISVPTKGFIDVLQTVQALPSFRTADGRTYPINPMTMAFFSLYLLFDFLIPLYKVN